MASESGRVVAVVGVTGAVGQVLLRVLESRKFPVRELRALASERSEGTQVRFAGRDVDVAVAQPEAFTGVDFAFFAATGSLSKELGPEVARRGGIAIDKSATWRLEPHVPLVVPEINGAEVERHQGIISNPNCTTIGFVMALEPIRRAAGVRSVVVTTVQATTGAGLPGLEDLETQLEATGRGEAPPPPKMFARQPAHNVVPLCETFREDGYSTEEVKLRYETQKILGDDSIDVTMTCLRVPVRVGHGATMLVETERPLEVSAAREALAAFPGVEVVDDPSQNAFPTPLDAEGQDDVIVGRIRRDFSDPRRLWLWQVSDNLRKGAATNAVQIAEEVLRRNALRR